MCVCRVDDPVKELPRLKEKIDEQEHTDPRIRKYYYVQQGELNGPAVSVMKNLSGKLVTLRLHSDESDDSSYLGALFSDGAFDIVSITIVL
jgi:hypothetical protein